MTRLLLPVLALLVVGCHTAARDTTFGVLDAIERPDPRDPLSVKLHTLADRYVDGALAAGPGPGLDKVLADAVVSVLKTAQMHAPQELAMLQVAVRATILTSIATLKEQVPDAGALSRSSAAVGSGLVDGVAGHEDQIVSMLARSSGEAGRAFARGAADELFTEVGPTGDGPLSRALAGALQRAAGAIVEGAAGRAPGDVAPSADADPRHGAADVVRNVSRSAAMGVAEGVGREVGPWGLCAAALAGMLLALGGHWAVRRVARRLASTRRPAPSPRRGPGDVSRRALAHRQRAHARRR